jgi:class 3 adenylate cyclase
MGPVARRLSIATRVALLIVLVAIFSLAVTTAFAVDRGSDLMTEAVRDRLDAVVAGRADGVLRYLRAREDAISALATSPATAEAVRGFAVALEELGRTPPPPAVQDRLAAHYLTEVVPELEAARGTPVPVSSLLPITDAGITLQAGWVTTNREDVDPSTIDDNRDGTDWTELHAQLHPTFRRLAEVTGFDDLALVSLEGDVVYTVRKGIDLGTNLRVGPHSGSVAALAASRVVADPTPGRAVVSDLARTPSVGDRPVGVVAGPVLDRGRLVGVVVGQYDATALTGILSAGNRWPGLGETGQVYLTAADGTMRSDARAFLADPRDYLASAGDLLTTAEQRSIRVLGTTAGLQPVDAGLTRAAAVGPGDGRALSPTGTPVVASWRPLEIDGLEWVVVAEIPSAELEQPLARFGRFVLVAVALVVLVTTFAAVAWSNRLLQPLRQIAEGLRTARATGTPISVRPTSERGTPREYRELSDHIDEMLARLSERHEDVRRRQEERRTLLRQFLPPAMADRAEDGEQDVLDRVERTSVVVVELRGLGALLEGHTDGDSSDLLGALVDDLDAAARQHGLERVRLGGNSYVAVCGASRPHHDHAPRALAFARDVPDLVADLAARTNASLSVGLGLTSGPVVVGLSGGDRLVFDCWGATVDRAGDLARVAGSGAVLIDPATRALLHDVVATTTPPGARPHEALRVVDREPSAGGAT